MTELGEAEFLVGYRQFQAIDARLEELELKRLNARLDFEEQPAGEAEMLSGLLDIVTEFSSRIDALRQFRTRLAETTERTLHMDLPSLKVRSPEEAVATFRNLVGSKEDQFLTFFVNTSAPGEGQPVAPDAEKRLKQAAANLKAIQDQLTELESRVSPPPEEQSAAVKNTPK